MAELNARIIAKASATAAEEPLAADLEVAELAVNTADGKLFTKHSDGSVVTISGGGGGAVDSVNGETGVVSLGIEDMDDFDYGNRAEASFSDPQGSGTWSDWMDAHSNPPGYEFPTSQGEWRAYTNTSSGTSTIQLASLDDDGSSCEGWSSISVTNLLMLLTVDGQTYGPIPVTTISDGSTYGVFIQWNSSDFDPSLYSWGYEFGNPALAPTSPRPIKPFTIQLGYTFLAATSGTLVEGDILQWNNSDQKFKSAQPIERIQEMDDFELTTSLGQARYEFSTAVGSTPADGLCANYASTGWAFNTEDYDGNDLTSSLDEMANKSTAVTYEVYKFGQLIGSGTAGWSQANYTVGSRWIMTLSDDSWKSGLTNGDILTFGLSILGSSQPLTDGDILQWNAFTQKFNPAQPKERIQDMDDFELNPASPWVYDFLWETKLASGVSNLAGEWGTNSVRWAATDSEGTTFSATGTQQFWISPNNVTWTEVNGNVINYTVDSNNYFYIENSGTLTTQIDNEGWSDLYLTFTDPTNHPLGETPLEEGDILQWDNASQEFKPAQLPDAAATRALLGISEYVDDAAAGTGGVTSGGMYYNTTSSDYRLKS